MSNESKFASVGVHFPFNHYVHAKFSQLGRHNGRDKRKGVLHVGIGIAKFHAVLPWRRANGNESHGHCCN